MSTATDGDRARKAGAPHRPALRCCPVCARTVPLAGDGTVTLHMDHRPDARPGDTCAGSGLDPEG